jgi:hypothetical protein
MFSIRILSSEESEPGGPPLGEITMGDFTERFACYPADSWEVKWREQLQALVDGKSVALLVHDPRFAWVVFREGDVCFVQQQLSRDGTFTDLPGRSLATEEGDPVSEWTTSVEDIRAFLQT